MFCILFDIFVSCPIFVMLLTEIADGKGEAPMAAQTPSTDIYLASDLHGGSFALIFVSID